VRKLLVMLITVAGLLSYQNCAPQKMSFERVDLNSVAGVGIIIVPDPNNANEVEADLKYQVEISVPAEERIVSRSIRIDNSEIQYHTDAFGNLSFSFIPRDVKTFEIIATAVTESGVTLETRELVVIRDERPPIITITPASANVYDLHQTLNFGFDVHDVGGGQVANVTCALNGAAHACSFDPASGKGAISFTDLDSGNYTLTVSAADNFNNQSSESLPFSVAFDTLAPTITLSAVAGNTYYTIDVQNFEYRVSEFGSGLKSVLCTLDGVAVNCAMVNNVLQTLSLQPQTEGTHTIKITATDNQNNSNSAELPFHSLVDKVPPVIVITANAANSYLLTETQDFAFSIRDLESGLASYSCSLDGQSLPCTLQSDGTGSLTLSPATAGNHTLAVTAKDRYGNERVESLPFSMRKDVSSPKVVLTASPANEYFVNMPLTFSFTVSKEVGSTPIASVTCLQGSVEIDCHLNAEKSAGSFTITETTAGSKTVSVIAKNTAGNIGSDAKNYSVGILSDKSNELNVATVKKVDVLFVVDNSGSMKEEQANLAQRVSSFVSKVAGMDWRAAVTTTDLNKENGKLLPIKNMTNQYFVDSGMDTATAQLNLGATIQMGTNGSSAEQGIAATYNAVVKSGIAPNNSFFRADAALAVIVISDENESGTAAANSPTNLIELVKTTWPSKTFSFSSIVKVNSSCSDGTIGTTYMDLSRLTGEGLAGGAVIGCVGDADYSSVLSKIGTSVQNIYNVVRLDCSPYKNTVTVNVNGSIYSGSYTISGTILSFDQTPPDGVYTLSYKCASP